jgi:hypothetical protein
MDQAELSLIEDYVEDPKNKELFTLMMAASARHLTAAENLAQRFQSLGDLEGIGRLAWRHFLQAVVLSKCAMQPESINKPGDLDLAIQSYKYIERRLDERVGAIVNNQDIADLANFVQLTSQGLRFNVVTDYYAHAGQTLDATLLPPGIDQLPIEEEYTTHHGIRITALMTAVSAPDAAEAAIEEALQTSTELADAIADELGGAELETTPVEAVSIDLDTATNTFIDHLSEAASLATITRDMALAIVSDLRIIGELKGVDYEAGVVDALSKDAGNSAKANASLMYAVNIIPGTGEVDLTGAKIRGIVSASVKLLQQNGSAQQA